MDLADKRIYVKTHGCSLNVADSEAMIGQLTHAGCTLVESSKDADLVILNTCTVKNKTDRVFRKELREYKSKPLIVAGCIPEATPERKDIQEFSLLGTEQLSHIVDSVKETLEGKRTVRIGRSKEARLELKSTPIKKDIAIIPIAKGCLSNCSYCQTKLARKDLESFGVRRIVERIATDVSNGSRHVWLTSQDCSAYGLDIGTTCGILCKEVCSVPGDFKVRLGMANPLFFKRIGKDLIESFSSDKMYKFLHVPVQSGSNHVLKIMKRGYKVQDFVEVVDAFRRVFPDITIATDIIVGHPGESDQDFEATMQLLKEVRPTVINFSKFSARPQTPAEKMQQVSVEKVKQRMDILKEWLQRHFTAQNNALVGQDCEVIVEQARGTHDTLCRTDTYRPVVVPGIYDSGTRLRVSITEANAFHLKAEVLDHNA